MNPESQVLQSASQNCGRDPEVRTERFAVYQHRDTAETTLSHCLPTNGEEEARRTTEPQISIRTTTQPPVTRPSDRRLVDLACSVSQAKTPRKYTEVQ